MVDCNREGHTRTFGNQGTRCNHSPPHQPKRHTKDVAGTGATPVLVGRPTRHPTSLYGNPFPNGSMHPTAVDPKVGAKRFRFSDWTTIGAGRTGLYAAGKTSITAETGACASAQASQETQPRSGHPPTHTLRIDQHECRRHAGGPVFALGSALERDGEAVRLGNRRKWQVEGPQDSPKSDAAGPGARLCPVLRVREVPRRWRVPAAGFSRGLGGGGGSGRGS